MGHFNMLKKNKGVFACFYFRKENLNITVTDEKIIKDGEKLVNMSSKYKHIGSFTGFFISLFNYLLKFVVIEMVKVLHL